MANLVSTQQTLDVRTMAGISGKCVLTQVGAGPIAANAQTQMFVDGLAQAATGGIPLTNADANFFNGAVPNMEIFTIFGMQLQVGVLLANLTDFDVVANTTPGLVQDILDRISFEILLKGQTLEVGSMLPLPSGQCWDGFSLNGGRNVPTFRFPPELVLQLKGNDTFSLRFTTTAPITLPTAGSSILIYAYLPASKGIPLGQLSLP